MSDAGGYASEKDMAMNPARAGVDSRAFLPPSNPSHRDARFPLNISRLYFASLTCSVHSGMEDSAHSGYLLALCFMSHF